MKKKIEFITQNAVFLFIIIFIVSCVAPTKLKYFNDIDQIEEPIANPREQKVIMPFDNLYIRVISIDEKTNQIFNSRDEFRNNTTSSLISYSVDDKGDINFPFVGNINVATLTTAEAGLKIQKALNEYVSNTAIVVKFVDNQVSVLGEVQHEGVYTFSQDKLNIYEALALGGGISRFGNRKNVILIRQEGDKIFHHKLDLTDSKIAGKDYFFIQPNDVIVVEPLRSAAWAYNNNVTFTALLSSITTFLAFYTVFLMPKK